MSSRVWWNGLISTAGATRRTSAPPPFAASSFSASTDSREPKAGVTIAIRLRPAIGLLALVRRDRLVGLAVLVRVLRLFRLGEAVGEVFFVAVLGDVLEVGLGQLEALRLALAALDQRLFG